MFAVFGAILSQVVMRQGIAQRIVRVAAEYAGDHKVLLALLLTGAMAVVFTSLTGLGAVIMISSLALPIMTGAGLSGTYAACLMLLAISLGGVFNPANLGFFSEVLKVDFAQVKSFAMAYGLLLGLATLAFLLIEGRRESQRFVWALQDAGAAPPVPIYALITPIIPIALIGLPGLKIGIPLTDIEFFTVPGTPFPIIPAFLAGILYGCLTTEPTRTIPNLTAAFLEGLKDVAPVIGLFIGIGMMLNAMMDDSTKLIMKPFIEAILPRSAAGFVLFFTLLAPLTLYRGPLNTYGLGAGFALLIVGSGLIPAAAVMAAFLCVGQMQGVCDPTNTHNVWIAQFTKGSTETFMKKTVPYVWAFILLALIYAVAVRGVMG